LRYKATITFTEEHAVADDETLEGIKEEIRRDAEEVAHNNLWTIESFDVRVVTHGE
jgi:hypothetical protein